MSANKKIILIILLGIGATLISFMSSRYLLEMDHANKLVLLNINKTKEQVEQVKLLSKDFIQTADQETWQQIIQNIQAVQTNLEQTATSADSRWNPKLDALKDLLDDYFKILTSMHDPAVHLNEEKRALQGLGLSFSKEVEDKIIKPYKEEEGLRLYKGQLIDPFKTRTKDTAYELVALHIKQQLILLNLLLSDDINTYRKKKAEIASALNMHKARLRYLNILMGNEPQIQITIKSLNNKLTILIEHERKIVEYFETLTKLTQSLVEVDEKLMIVIRDLSNQILSDTQASHRLYKTASWALLILIVAGLSFLGALLGRDIIRFVHSLKQIQEDLKKSENNLMVTLDSIGDAVIVTDSLGLITRMNPSAVQLTGWTMEDAVGKELPEVFNIVDGKTREKAENPAEKVIAEGKVVGLANDTVLISKNGAEFQIADSGAPILNNDGKMIGVVMVFRDVTETYNSMKIIHESERLLKNITANIPGVVFQFSVTHDRQYPIHFISEKMKDLLGIEASIPADLKDFSSYIPEEDRERFFTSIEKSVANLSNWDYEGNFIKSSGEVVCLSGTSVPYSETGDDHNLSYYGVLMDVTERKLTELKNKKLESTLRQSQKMEAIGTLAGGIAHDFNNILAGIVGYSQLGLRKSDNNSHLSKYFQQIYDASIRASNLVKQILTFSRRTDHELTSIQISPLLNEALKLLRSSTPTNIQIDYKISADLDTIVADPTQIHQIIMNLCTNAVHAMEEKGGHLFIDLSQIQLSSVEIDHYPELKPGRYIKLTVQDTGYGISTENIEKIFDPYYTTKDKEKGTGLGLSVIHGIVKEYNGAIYVYSERGKGSTFNVYLPSTRDEVVPEIQSDVDLPEGNESVLLVDDEITLTDLGEQILTHLGYSVTSSNSSREALEIFLKSPEGFDLVISDMTMPEMTGDNLAIKILQTRKNMPIILYTGYSHNISEERAAEIGVKALAMKPLVMHDLAVLIRKVLDDASKADMDSNWQNRTATDLK